MKTAAGCAFVRAQDVGQVAGSVARRGHGGQREAAGAEPVPVAGGHPAEAHILGRRHDVVRARAAGQSEPAGDVVVVDVGLEHVGDADGGGLGDGENPVDVPLRVDDGGVLAVVDQVAAVAEPGGLDRNDVMHALPSWSGPPVRRRPQSLPAAR